MMAHSPGVQISSKAASGGIMEGLKRSVLCGESFFSTTYTAPAEGGWVDIAGVLPGDMLPLEIQPDRPCFVVSGNWMANSEGMEVTSQFGGMKNLFGGEGGFGLEASGQGLSVYGAVDVMDLAPGERDVIHTGHVIAYDLGMQFTTRRAVEGRSIQSMKSGEGLVSTSSGPGACSCSHATRRRSRSGPPSSCPRRTSRAASAGCSTDRQGVRAAASRVGRWRRSRPTCRGCRTRRPTPPARGSR